MRQLESRWNAEPKAHEVDRHDELVKKAVEIIVERAQGVAGLPAGEAKEIEDALKARLDQWEEQQRIPGRCLAYRDRRDGVTVGLLSGARSGRWGVWTCLTSLRDVEPAINLILDTGDLAEGHAPAYEFPKSESPAEQPIKGEPGSSKVAGQEASSI